MLLAISPSSSAHIHHPCTVLPRNNTPCAARNMDAWSAERLTLRFFRSFPLWFRVLGLCAIHPSMDGGTCVGHYLSWVLHRSCWQAAPDRYFPCYPAFEVQLTGQLLWVVAVGGTRLLAVLAACGRRPASALPPWAQQMQAQAAPRCHVPGCGAANRHASCTPACMRVGGGAWLLLLAGGSCARTRQGTTQVADGGHSIVT